MNETSHSDRAPAKFSDKWHWLSQSLHWVMALLIIANVVLAKYADTLGLSPKKLKIFLWHKSIGITVLVLALLRLGWLWYAGRPSEPHAVAAWQRWSARASHFMMYLLMLAMPISGWILNSAANVPLRLFGWIELPALVSPDEALKQSAAATHDTLFTVFAVVLTLHILAALKHHYLDRHGVLKAMLPIMPDPKPRKPDES